MTDFLTTVRNQPYEKKRRIFFGIMVVCGIIVAALYLLSIGRTVGYAVDEEKKKGESVLGEFHLPALKESISAGLIDVLKKKAE